MVTRSEVNLCEWLQLPILGYQGMISEGKRANDDDTRQSQTCDCSSESGPVRQLLLRLVYVETNEEPLCIFSLAVGHNAAVQQ